jgi:hypothetical protein
MIRADWKAFRTLKNEARKEFQRKAERAAVAAWTQGPTAVQDLIKIVTHKDFDPKRTEHWLDKIDKRMKEKDNQISSFDITVPEVEYEVTRELSINPDRYTTEDIYDLVGHGISTKKAKELDKLREAKAKTMTPQKKSVTEQGLNELEEMRKTGAFTDGYIKGEFADPASIHENNQRHRDLVTAWVEAIEDPANNGKDMMKEVFPEILGPEEVRVKKWYDNTPVEWLFREWGTPPAPPPPDTSEPWEFEAEHSPVEEFEEFVDDKGKPVKEILGGANQKRVRKGMPERPPATKFKGLKTMSQSPIIRRGRDKKTGARVYEHKDGSITYGK